VVAVGEVFLQVAPDLKSGDNTARDRVLVLVDEAVSAGDVDREAAARELADADCELAGWKGELDGAHAALVLRRGWAQARLDAANRAAPTH
jgi:F0F1-type ATP synthase epsilon subunit